MNYSYPYICALVLCLNVSVCAQTKNASGKGTNFNNKGKGQQNNNTGLGTQKIYNNQKSTTNKITTNKINRQVTVNDGGIAFLDSSKLIVNNYSVPEKGWPVIESNLLKELYEFEVDSNTVFYFSSYGQPDANFYATKMKVIEILKKNGFKNFNDHIQVILSNVVPNHIELTYYTKSNEVDFAIPPR